MSNEDRSRRVWRMLERGWTSARALRNAIEQVRDKVDEARVRLSDEVVSRLAGQPVRTTSPDPAQPDSDPILMSASGGPPSRPTDELQQEISEAADAVSSDAVAAEAEKSAGATSAAPTVVAHSGEPSDDPEPTESERVTNRPIDVPAVAPERPTEPADVESFSGAAGSRPNPPDSPAGDPAGNATPVFQETANAGELVVLARDSEWLFVYWELDERRLSSVGRIRGDRQYLLRILQPTGAGLVHQSSAAVPSGRRYVRVPFADASYLAELWARGLDDEVLIARSLPAATPPMMPRPPGATALVSSIPHIGVLNEASDLTRVPKLETGAARPVSAEELERPARAEEGAPAEEGEGAEVEWSGSEARLRERAPDSGSEERLGGSEERLGGSEERLGGSEERLGGSEERLRAYPGGSEERLGFFEGSEARLGQYGLGSEGRLGAFGLGSEGRLGPRFGIGSEGRLQPYGGPDAHGPDGDAYYWAGDGFGHDEASYYYGTVDSPGEGEARSESESRGAIGYASPFGGTPPEANAAPFGPAPVPGSDAWAADQAAREANGDVPWASDAAPKTTPDASVQSPSEVVDAPTEAPAGPVDQEPAVPARPTTMPDPAQPWDQLLGLDSAEPADQDSHTSPSGETPGKPPKADS